MGIARNKTSRLIRVELSVTVDSDAAADRARALFRELRSEALMRFHRGDRPAIAITADTIDRFLLWKEPSSGCGADTLRRIRVRLVSFADFFGGRALSLITADDMAAWYRAVASRRGHARRYNRDREGLSPETVQKYLQSLRQFCSWARDVVHGAPADLPCERFRIRSCGKIKGNRYPPKALTYNELLRILRRISDLHPHVGVVLRSLVLFGARPVQLFRIRWEDYRKPTKKHAGIVHLGACKGAPERSIEIPYGSHKHRVFLQCAELFVKNRRRRHRACDLVFVPVRNTGRGGGWSTSVFDHRVGAICGALKIKGFTPYVLRHTLCTLLQQHAVSLASVQATMGHMNVDTQRVYGHRTSTDAVRGLAQVEKLMPDLWGGELPEQTGKTGVVVQSQLPLGLTL